MRPSNNLAENKLLPVFWKLLHDLLFILLVSFALSLAAEALLPGIIGRYFGMSKFIVLILGNVFLITLLGNLLRIKPAPLAANKKMILVISFFGIVLILNGLLKMNIFLNLFITLLAISIAYLSYLVITQEEQK